MDTFYFSLPNTYPEQQYQPSGHMNISRSRESYLNLYSNYRIYTDIDFYKTNEFIFIKQLIHLMTWLKPLPLCARRQLIRSVIQSMLDKNNIADAVYLKMMFLLEWLNMYSSNEIIIKMFFVKINIIYDNKYLFGYNGKTFLDFNHPTSELTWLINQNI